MDDLRIEPLHRVGRALSDPTRCRILLCLLHEPHYPTDLADHLRLTRANVSNHLAFLRDCGLVTATQEGRRQRYELADPRLAHAMEDLAGLAAQIAKRSKNRPRHSWQKPRNSTTRTTTTPRQAC